MTTKTYHPELAAGRWFTLSLAEQLGNVGSEYERALSWKERGDKDRFEHAFARLLELLDLTIADQRWRNHRLKELTRLREVICDEFFNEIPEFIHPTDLREYFLYFGVLARSERDKAADANVRHGGHQ
ncbi:MAG TPA: hypothetical protein VGO68_09045 [Pyrinomonadaceae bacterium]|jgi:hypothetical protein|nr:hypothetical protein [Pyrinomonadaceae bacterium]